MLEQLRMGFADWWSTVTPEFAFLLALPFVVACAAAVGEWVRWHRRRAVK